MNTKEKILRDYIADVHAMFAKWLIRYVMDSVTYPDEELKLRALLEEIIRIKTVIVKETQDI